MKSHYITLKPHEITIFLVKPPFSHGFLSTCWAIQASPVVCTGPCWAPMAPGGRQRCSPTGRRTWVENGFWALQKCWFHWNWTIVIGVLNQLSYLGGPTLQHILKVFATNVICLPSLLFVSPYSDRVCPTNLRKQTIVHKSEISMSRFIIFYNILIKYKKSP
jgi:hypothetical protein